MVTRKPVRRAAPAKAVARKAAPVARKAKAAPAKAAKDVTVYAEKEPTDYHKAFAKWLVTEVGVDPNAVANRRSAFLMGVSLACVARGAFGESDFIEEWREAAGITKRGPKRSTEEAEEEEEIDEEEEEETEEEDEEDEDSDDDEESDEEDEEEEEDDDEEEEEEEPEPAPKRRAPVRGKAPVKKAAPAKKAAPKRAPVKKAAAKGNFLF